MRNRLPRRLIASFLLAAVFFLPPSAWAGDGVKAILGATVVNPGSAPIEDAVVLIQGDRIFEVGKVGDIAVPGDAELVLAEGKWVIPGMIDGHVHLSLSGSLYARPDIIDLRARRSFEEETAWIRENIEDVFARYLMSGVTGLADLGGPLWIFDVREKAQALDAAPRTAVSGPLLATHRPTEMAVDDPPMYPVDSPEQGRVLVQRLAGRDPDFIKIWGIVLPGRNPRDLYPLIRAIVEESGKHDIRVVAHATELETARTAVEAGVQVLAHGVRDQVVDESFVRLLKEKEVVYIPTLMVAMRYEEVFRQQIELTEAERKLTHPRILSSLFDLGDIPEDELPADLLRRMKAADSPAPNPVSMKNLKMLQDAGVAIAVGSDAGNIGTPHGPAIFREMELMAQAGLSPEEVLAAATANGARLLGMPNDLGVVGKGYLADLVILSANPLENVKNIQKVDRVMVNGDWLEYGAGPAR